MFFNLPITGLETGTSIGGRPLRDSSEMIK